VPKFGTKHSTALLLKNMPKTSNVTLPRLWLASSSPRRAQLLTLLGFEFQTCVSDAEEADWAGDSVEDTVSENANRKAKRVLTQVPPGDIIIAADTLVAVGNRAISKPSNRMEAIENLKTYSGDRHRVLTGLTLAASDRPMQTCVVETTVWFRNLNAAEIDAYTLTAEPYDKAGGYGIQGVACLFISKVEGSFSNVMGLPTEKLLTELENFTGISPFSWVRKWKG
jgi:septum formation protein